MFLKEALGYAMTFSCSGTSIRRRFRLATPISSVCRTFLGDQS